MNRPQPPERLTDLLNADEEFAPAPDLLAWVRATFLESEGAAMTTRAHASGKRWIVTGGRWMRR